jgi:hypothetical protein
LRPFLDLGPLIQGPLFAQGIEFAYQAAINEDIPSPYWQLHVSGALRGRIIAESGLREYAITHPRDLAPALRTPRWQRMVELLDEVPRLDARRLARLCTLLESLGLYSTLEQLRSEAQITPGVLAVSVSHARYKLGGGRDRGDHVETRTDLIASPRGDERARLVNVMFLVVAHGRGRNREQLLKWRAVAESLHSVLRPDDDPRDTLIESAYWRAVSFVPFVLGDRAATVRELDLAESYGRRLLGQGTPMERWMADYNLHPILETRTKEALWCGDKDLALARTQELCAHDPYDAKVHVELGDLYLDRGELESALTAYRRAAEVGVPYTPFARFMIGHCLEKLGDVDAALAELVAAVELDPAAITPLQRIAELAHRTNRASLKAWANHAAESRMKNVARPRNVTSAQGGLAL